MYSKILQYLHDRPPVYSSSTSAFWNDAHISKHILKAHLAPDVESASRKLLFIQNSVNWIVDICDPQEKRFLLDLGCGPGIYSELFHKASYHVTGIDFSKHSIDYATKSARANQMQIQYLYQNYLDMDYEATFDIITLIYCDFGVLPPSDRQILLKKIRKALKKEGVFVVDGFTSRDIDDFSENQSIESCDNGFWSKDSHICIRRNYLYPETQNYLEQYIIITKNDCQCYNIWNQIFTAESLSDELKNAGFEDIMLFDDVCGKPLSKISRTICAVAK